MIGSNVTTALPTNAKRLDRRRNEIITRWFIKHVPSIEIDGAVLEGASKRPPELKFASRDVRVWLDFELVEYISLDLLLSGQTAAERIWRLVLTRFDAYTRTWRVFGPEIELQPRRAWEELDFAWDDDTGKGPLCLREANLLDLLDNGKTVTQRLRRAPKSKTQWEYCDEVIEIPRQ